MFAKMETSETVLTQNKSGFQKDRPATDQKIFAKLLDDIDFTRLA